MRPKNIARLGADGDLNELIERVSERLNLRL
jgi:hypothetical protein